MADGAGSIRPHRPRGVRTQAELDASKRADTQRHLDARTARLEAYAASLEEALGRSPGAANAEQLTRQLGDVRRQIAQAAQSSMAPVREAKRNAAP